MGAQVELKHDFRKNLLDGLLFLEQLIVEGGLEFPDHGKNMDDIRVIRQQKNCFDLRCFAENATDHILAGSGAFAGQCRAISCAWFSLCDHDTAACLKRTNE